MHGEPSPTASHHAHEAAELTRAIAERDFFRDLVLLGTVREIEPLIERVLALIVDVTGAEQAYVEIGAGAEPYFFRAHGCDGQDALSIRASVSRSVVNEALSTGRTVIAASAVKDPRFATSESVRRHRIDAVLCATFGAPGARGIVYLCGRRGAGPFGKSDIDRVDMLAAELAPAAHELVEARRQSELDATAPVRRRLRCDGLVGRSAALAEALEQVALAAPLDIDVLISGQSGTGKTALARVIADNSGRAGGPFVELNCAALPDTLFESEIFGAAKGGHSTANREIKGKLAAAQGGTLFLDEIAELSLSGQAKLLQVLQSRTYYPLGATKPLSADVRVIAATNRDLNAAVSAGRFRDDLYYRLNVMPVHMPCLAERRDDVPLLVLRCAEVAIARHRLRPMSVSAAALMACRCAPWPGNVRELANTVEAAVIRAHGRGSTSIDVAHLFPSRSGSTSGHASTLHEATRLFQRELLERTLDEVGWNVTSASRRLGIARSYLYTLIELHALRRAPSQSRAS